MTFRSVIFMFTFFTIVLSTTVMASSYPPANELPQVGGNTVVDGASRIRIRFEMEDVSEFGDLGIEAVDFCGIPAQCNRALQLNQGFELNADDQIMFAYALAPSGNNGRHVHIRSSRPNPHAPKLVRPRIRLDDELVLEENYNYEMIVRLVRQGRRNYRPVLLAIQPMGPSETNVTVFEPGVSSTTNVAGGFKVELPGQMVNDTVLFGYEANRADFTSGNLSISPAMSFANPARILIEFELNNVPTGDVLSAFEFRLNGTLISASDTGTFSNGRAVIETQISEGGILSIEARNPIESSRLQYIKPEINSRALATDTCVARINAIMNGSQDYFQYADIVAAVPYNSCIDVYPYVHFVVTKVDDARNTMTLARQISPSGSSNAYTLRTITEHAQAVGAYAAINGFVWNGSSGIGNGTGDFLGTHYVDGFNVSNNSGAEAVIGFSDRIGGLTFASFFDKPAGGALNLGIYDHNVVSSTSSIVKNNVCSSSQASPGPRNSWSTIGLRGNYLVMFSTDSGRDVTPFDFCQLYDALGVSNAIRLDGSTAASIYVSGVHKNPLSGFDRFIYGSARHILYGIAVQ